MTFPEPTKYSMPDGTAYTITDTANLTKRQQVALAMLPPMIDWHGHRYDLAVKDAYKIADMFLEEQS